MNVTNLPGETWVTITEHPNYQVSNKGRVYSIPRKGSSGGLLTPFINKQGYPVVKLDRRNYPIHILLGKHFIPNPDNKLWVLHRYDNKKDFTLENLYWGTPSENKFDSWDNGCNTRKTYSFYTDTGELVTTNNLPLWCKERNIPLSRVESSLYRNRPVNTTPGGVDKWGNKK